MYIFEEFSGPIKSEFFYETSKDEYKNIIAPHLYQDNT